jgi:hypothetical protein
MREPWQALLPSVQIQPGIVVRGIFVRGMAPQKKVLPADMWKRMPGGAEVIMFFDDKTIAMKDALLLDGCGSDYFPRRIRGRLGRRCRHTGQVLMRHAKQ